LKTLLLINELFFTWAFIFTVLSASPITNTVVTAAAAATTATTAAAIAACTYYDYELCHEYRVIMMRSIEKYMKY
jgi:hypothetical protein